MEMYDVYKEKYQNTGSRREFHLGDIVIDGGVHILG